MQVRGLVAGVIEGGRDFPFVPPVQAGGGLIKNDDGGLADSGARNRNALALTAVTGSTAFAEDGVILLRKLRNKGMSIGDSLGLGDFLGTPTFHPEALYLGHAGAKYGTI